jgi:hypothetical protein
MSDALAEDLPIELRLVGHRVQFRLDVTGRVKATCRAFLQMLIREDGFDDAVRSARGQVRQLTALPLARHR